MNYGEGGLSASDVALLQGRNNEGFGDGNGWWIILFLIVLFGGYGNRGFGGFGGNNGGSSVYEGYVLNNDFSQIERKLDGIANGICDSTFALNNTVVNGNASIQQTLTQGFSGLNTGMVQQGYETRIGINGIGTQLAQCCCDIKGQVAENRYENSQNVNALNTNINAGFTGIQNAMCLNTRDVITSQENGTKAILDAITQNRIEDKNNQIAMLQTQLNNAELRASQEGQTREIINTIRPCPVPAYQSCNPWGCNCNQGCGCNM